jgi:hypothetical protein
LHKARAEKARLLCRAKATSTKLRHSGLWRDRDVDKMPKKMLIWQKQTKEMKKRNKVGLMTDLG